MLASGPAGRRSGRRIPAARLADLRHEGPAERVADEPSGSQDAIERNARLPAGGIEEVDEVLRRKIAGGPRSVGAAAGPTCRGVEAADPGVEACRDVCEGSAPRVVEVIRDPLERDAG